MSEHYTQSTDEVLIYCSKCGRLTVHKVSAGRLGHCMECVRAPKVKRPRPEQFKLFEVK